MNTKMTEAQANERKLAVGMALLEHATPAQIKDLRKRVMKSGLSMADFIIDREVHYNHVFGVMFVRGAGMWVGVEPDGHAHT